MMEEPKIGLALSGGGSRAIAFHLGCLRALHQNGVLNKVRVISTVSGGSVIGALYAAKDQSFLEFEKEVRALLVQGLVSPALRKALTTAEGLRAAFCWSSLALFNCILAPLKCMLRILSLALPSQTTAWRLYNLGPPFTRFASRTTILRCVLDEDVFRGMRLRDLPASRPLLIVNAAELRTGSAFYFSRERSGSWRLGELAGPDTTLAHAVTASAAYPVFLPALDERLAFNKRDGSRRVEHVTLTDGGVYDNLGLAPLWPDRDPAVSLNVVNVDTVICCRAGYGLRFDPPSQFLFARMKSVFACATERAQNVTMKRLHDLKASGQLSGFIVPFLGQVDARLQFPPDDLVRREDTYNYRTDFSPMPEDWIDLLGKRGEQLTYALLAEHLPRLLLAEHRPDPKRPDPKPA